MFKCGSNPAMVIFRKAVSWQNEKRKTASGGVSREATNFGPILRIKF